MVKMGVTQELRQTIEEIKKLLQSDVTGVEVINFREPINIHIYELQTIIDILTYNDGKHYWFIAGTERKRYDLFVFDNEKELKRIIIESHFNVERIFIMSIQLIRYPR
uniref:Uncharacterized protein n=1 Tax=Sulfolobus islandicus rod-shaped virus 1 TaxID=157898 RepID=Q5W360_SIRV1|nr:hypothetical protein [Sulfolobus islandicus rod-shaped virus 1]